MHLNILIYDSYGYYSSQEKIYLIFYNNQCIVLLSTYLMPERRVE